MGFVGRLGNPSCGLGQRGLGRESSHLDETPAPRRVSVTLPPCLSTPLYSFEQVTKCITEILADTLSKPSSVPATSECMKILREGKWRVEPSNTCSEYGARSSLQMLKFSSPNLCSPFVWWLWSSLGDGASKHGWMANLPFLLVCSALLSHPL